MKTECSKMDKTCITCKKGVLWKDELMRCHVIKEPEYFIKKYGECFAWTDEKDWEKKVKQEVELYSDR